MDAREVAAGQDRKGGRQHLIQAAPTAGGPARTANPAPTANGCTARTTSAGLANRPSRSLASIRPRAPASRSGTSGRGSRIGGTGAPAGAFLFRYTEP